MKPVKKTPVDSPMSYLVLDLCDVALLPPVDLLGNVHLGERRHVGGAVMVGGLTGRARTETIHDGHKLTVFLE